MASVPRPAAAVSAAASHPDIHAHRILILDFGAQYTQLIARRVRELGVYCEIHPWDMSDAQLRDFRPRGVILSGGPESVTAADAPHASAAVFELGVPVLHSASAPLISRTKRSSRRAPCGVWVTSGWNCTP